MKVRFINPVQHDATSYAVGDEADFSAKLAKALIAQGSAEPAEKPAADAGEQSGGEAASGAA